MVGSMSTTGMNPEGSHVEFSVYCSHLAEQDALRAVCDLLQQLDCSPTGCALLGPPVESCAFEYTTDLPLVLGEWPTCRSGLVPYRVGFHHRLFGDVLVLFSEAKAPDRHPVAVCMSDGPFGIPEAWRDAAKRDEAPQFREQLGRLFRAACSSLDPRYAAVTFEDPMPTPGGFRRRAPVPADLYVASALLLNSNTLETALQVAFSGFAVIREDRGVHFSSWLFHTDSFFDFSSRQSASLSALMAQAVGGV